MGPNNCLFSVDGMLKTDLCHHGVKGQKWGVRRYQNPDGTLTPEGKKRYAQLRKGRKSEPESKSGTTKTNSTKVQYAPSSFFDRMEEINRRNTTDGKSPETDKMMQDLMLDLFRLSVKEPEPIMTGSKISSGEKKSFIEKAKKAIKTSFDVLADKSAYYDSLATRHLQQQIHRQEQQNLVNQQNQRLIIDQINQITQQNVQNHLAMMNTIPAPPPPPMPMFF